MNGESAASEQTPAASVKTAEQSGNSPTEAEIAGATDATAAQSTTQEPSLLGAVLSEMDLPEGMKPAVKAETKEEKPKEADIPTEEPAETEEPTEESPELAETETEDQEEEPTSAREEWPEDAKKRVADEARKRKKRTEERNRAYEVRDRLMQENDKLKAEIANASRPVPTRDNPLADIEDQSSLQKIQAQSRDLMEFAELTMADWENLDKDVDDNGVERIKVMVGQKEEKFTKRQLADMKLKAERTLNEQVPQRVTYLQERAKVNDSVYRLYPDLKNENSEMSQGVRQILQGFPEVKKSPEFLYWVANAVSRDLEIRSYLAGKKQGTNGEHSAAKKVIAAAKVPVVPAAVRSSSSSTGKSKVDSETARKRLTEGSEESGDLEALIASKLQGSRSGVQTVVS